MTPATAQKKMSAYLKGGGARMTAVDGKHIYNGTLPSASEILRVFSFGEFPNMEKMEEAAFIGTAVHETIASILNQEEGTLKTIEEEALNMDIAGTAGLKIGLSADIILKLLFLSL